MPIAKVTVGKSAYGCLNYVLTKDKAELLDTNCAGDAPAVIANEFEVAFQPHYRNGADRHTENYVAHFSIAFASEVERPKLEAIAHRFMGLMGFDPVMNQFVLAQHHDTDDCHLHLIENRIRLDGQVVSDSFQQRRTEVAMRTIEEEFDLPRLKNSWEVDVRAPHVAEVRQSRESGKPIPRRVMQETIERCVVGTGTLAELQAKLQESNVTLNATLRDDGSWALLYELVLEGEKVRTFSATKLGKRYTKRGLQSTFGVSFGNNGATAETTETGAVTVLPLVAPLTVLEETADSESKTTAGFDQNPGDVTPSFVQNQSGGTEIVGQEPKVMEAPSFVQKPLSAETSVDPNATTADTRLLEHPTVAVETVVQETHARETASFVQNPTSGAASFVQNPSKETETVLPEPNKTELPSFAQNPTNAQSSFAQNPTNDATSFVQKPQTLAVESKSFVQNSETLGDGNVDTSAKSAQTESLEAVLRWRQTYLETLELRAVWFGLQNASDQQRWEALSAQAQQRGLNDWQHIESAVTALACQQGYKTKSIVKLLQQSPRVKQAIAQSDFKTVEQTLTQNVVAVRRTLQQWQKEALKAAKQQNAK